MSIQLENVGYIDIPSFKYYFSADVFIVRLLGLSSISGSFSNAPREKRWWEAVHYFCGISTLVFFSACAITSVHQAAKTDIYYMMEALGESFLGVLLLSRAIRIWTHRDELYNLLRHLATFWQNAKRNRNITAEVLKTAESVKFVRMCYYGVVLGVAVGFCLQPYILLVSHHLYRRNESYDFSTTSYPIIYPFSLKTYTQYFICLIYEKITAVFGISYWALCDGLFAQITVHLSLQFEVLTQELSKISPLDNTSYEESTQTKNLGSISERHSKTLSYCSAAENFFNPIIFLTVLMNGADCCICVFNLEKEFSNRNVTQIIKILLRTLAVCGQTFVYCAYAERLTQQSSKMCDAIYNSPWTHQTKNIKLMLLTMLIRAQKEYSYTAYGIVSLNLRRVTAIANAAMTYFTLLRSFA